MKKMKFYFAMLLTFGFALITFADVYVPDEVPAPKEETKAVPVLTSTTPPVARDFEKEVTVKRTVEIDPSTQTFPVCSKCNGKIPPGRNYILTQEGKNYCSQTCFKADLPECCNCGKKMQKAYEKEGYLFCSQTCLEATWPKCQGCGIRCKVWKITQEHNEVYCPSCFTRPICHSCLRPNRFCESLKDGRYICPTCKKSAVTDQTLASKIVMEVHACMNEKLGFTPNTEGVNFSLVDVKKLRSASAYRHAGNEAGEVIKKNNTQTVEKEDTDLYGNAKEVKAPTSSTQYEIIILNNLSTAKFIETAAHELAILWLEQNYPNIGDKATREGFGEWAAARVNEAYGRAEMNIRMQNSKDQFYGDGYRMVSAQIKKNGFEGFKKYLEQLANPERP